MRPDIWTQDKFRKKKPPKTYNDLSFHVSQAFFPRTGAWTDLKKALKGTTTTACGTTWREPRAHRSRPASTRR